MLNRPGCRRVVHQNWIVELDARKWERQEVGGKALGISVLRSLGYKTPASFVVTPRTLSAVLGTAARMEQSDDVDTLLAHAIDRCLHGQLPNGLTEQLTSAITSLSRLGDRAQELMVRSSAVAEDAEDSGAPGIYHSTASAASLPAVTAALRDVWASSFSASAVRYREARGGNALDPQMAVLIQPRLNPGRSGVVYSIDPTRSDPEVCVVSWAEGSSASLLAGDEVGNTVSVRKKLFLGRKRSQDAIAPKFLEDVISAAKRVEIALNRPVDMEFVTRPDEAVTFVQLRSVAYQAPWKYSETLLGPIEQQRDLRSSKVRAAVFAFDEMSEASGLIVVRPQAFDRFRRDHTLDDSAESVILSAFDRLLDAGPVSIRPSYWSAVHSGDSLPQSGRLTTPDDCIAHLFRYWTYVLDEGLVDYSAEVGAICGNWLPTAGAAVALADPNRRSVDVFAVGGRLEELEGQVGDRFVVTFPDEPDTSIETRAAASESLHGPTIDRMEALSIGRVARRVANEVGHAVRAEFLLVPIDGDSRRCVIWQFERVDNVPELDAVFTVAKLETTSAGSADALVSGRVIRITDTHSFDPTNWDHAPEETLVVVDVRTLMQRDRHDAVKLAEQCRSVGAPVVIRANPLSHIAALLREYGLTVLPVSSISDDIVTGSIAAVYASPAEIAS